MFVFFYLGFSVLIIVAKLYGATQISTQNDNLAFFRCPENSFFSAFQPNSDYFRRNLLRYVESLFPKNDNMAYVNLLFDENYKKNGPFIRKVDKQIVANIGSEHLENLVKFYNYIFNIIISDFNISEEVWIPHQPILTPRQIQILFYVYNGLSSKQIAEKLNLSPRTIELHRQNSIDKIGGLTPKKLELFFSPVIARAFSQIYI